MNLISFQVCDGWKEILPGLFDLYRVGLSTVHPPSYPARHSFWAALCWQVGPRDLGDHRIEMLLTNAVGEELAKVADKLTLGKECGTLAYWFGRFENFLVPKSDRYNLELQLDGKSVGMYTLRYV